MSDYKIIVIGGGPAGMMAAIRAGQLSEAGTVSLFEKNNSLGKKLALTGNTRCNLTNVCPLDYFLNAFGKEGRFLRDAFGKFFFQDLLSFFQKRGLSLKAESAGKVYSQSGGARSVIEVLKKELVDLAVEVNLGAAIKNIEVNNGEVCGVSLEDGSKISVQKVIIATGGVSYPQTGSTGDGFRMAQSLGHKIEELSPGLVPLMIEESFVKELQGISLENVILVFEAGKKKVVSRIGEIIFTHFGISGPLVLDSSCQIKRLQDKEGGMKIFIDIVSALSKEDLDSKLQDDFKKYGVILLKNYLSDFIPKRMVLVFLKIAGINGEKKCHQVSLLERKKIVQMLKAFPLTFKGTQPISEAMVTRGGVSLKEVNPKTMESRRVKGLYFCGEVLDLAGISGGFNLQAAFSTGYLTGEKAVTSL